MELLEQPKEIQTVEKIVVNQYYANYFNVKLTFNDQPPHNLLGLCTVSLLEEQNNKENSFWLQTNSRKKKEPQVNLLYPVQVLQHNNDVYVVFKNIILAHSSEKNTFQLLFIYINGEDKRQCFSKPFYVAHKANEQNIISANITIEKQQQEIILLRKRISEMEQIVESQQMQLTLFENTAEPIGIKNVISCMRTYIDRQYIVTTQMKNEALEFLDNLENSQLGSTSPMTQFSNMEENYKGKIRELTPQSIVIIVSNGKNSTSLNFTQQFFIKIKNTNDFDINLKFTMIFNNQTIFDTKIIGKTSSAIYSSNGEASCNHLILNLLFEVKEQELCIYRIIKS